MNTSAREPSPSANAGTPKRAPITLTKAQVVAAGRDAFLAGRLYAQQPGFLPFHGCRYRNAGVPCVVGAALTDEQAEHLDRVLGDQSVGSLVQYGLLRTRSLLFLADLQRAHDGGKLDELAALLGLPADGAGNGGNNV